MITSVCQRWRAHRGVYRPAGEPIDPRDHEVAAIPDDTTAKTFVEREHYAHSYPAARERFGLYRRGALVGVAVFSVPVRPAVLRPCPADVAAELGRFVLLDGVPANGESWFLAECFARLRREGYAGVVSFSDPEPRTALDGTVTFRGHVGTIYQATNARYVGRSKPDTIHLLPDGTELARRGLVKVRKRERGWRYVVARLVAAGARPPTEDTPDALARWLRGTLAEVTRKVRHGGKHRYLFALDRAARRLLPAGLPYPKFSMRSA